MLAMQREDSSFCCIQKCMLPFHKSCHASASAVTLILWCELGPMHCLGHPGYCKLCDAVSRPAELSETLQEEVYCCKCSATSHEHEYVQCFYVVMAAGIANQEMLKPGQPLGYTLREIEAQSLKSCDDENGMHILLFCNCCDSKKMVLLLSFCEHSFAQQSANMLACMHVTIKPIILVTSCP